MWLVTEPTVRRFPDARALVEGAASDLVQRLARHVAASGSCRLAFAGGTTPRPVYERVAREHRAASVDWTRLELFWGDERCVPPDHPASNFRLVDEALLRHVPVPPAQVHRIEGERPQAEAARDYERLLGEQPLDVVLLGLGHDGHVASLFPGRPEAGETRARVVAAMGPEAPRERVSLSLRTINEARAVYFWVAGAAKAEAVARVFDEVQRGAPTLPAAAVRPSAGELHWFLDADAAGRL
jgi:6-phosphogluconolactonase